MSLDLFYEGSISDNFEIEAPSAGHACLPKIPAFVVLLGVQGRMTEILKQEQRLLVKHLLNLLRCFVVAAQEMFRVVEDHFPAGLFFFVRSLTDSWCNEPRKASCVLKGPKERPSL